jgi:hypothetical protein
MKPPFKMSYDEGGDVLYITGADNRPAIGEDHPVYAEGCVLRFADDTGELVGVTLVGTGYKSKLWTAPELKPAKV